MQGSVLAIEPDLQQAAALTRLVRDRAGADIVVVDSREAALAAIAARVPDVLLLSALLSPRDEDDLISHLRGLPGTSHLQTHTIPRLAGVATAVAPAPRRGLLSAFRKRKEPGSAASGCEPSAFADEVRLFLHAAAERKRTAGDTPAAVFTGAATRRAVPAGVLAPIAAGETGAVAGSAWASPFEWRADGNTSFIAESPAPAIEPESSAMGAVVSIDEAGALESLVHDDPAPAPPPGWPRIARWLRSEIQPPRPALTGGDDLRAMLARLAMPPAVAAVRYPRGCRIRRVRVLPPTDAALAGNQ